MKLTDLRTKQGRRREILLQVKENGGFSVFWVTGNLLRATVATEMVNRKEIVVTPEQYPWSAVKINKKGKWK